MKSRALTVFFLFLGLCASQGKTTARPKKAPAPTPAAVPKEQAAITGTTFEVNGWSLKAALVADKTEIMAGEPLFLTYQLQNAGRTALTLRRTPEATCLSERPLSISLTVTDPNGQPLPLPDHPIPRVGDVPATEQSFLPRDKYSARLLLGEWATLETPGTYTVTATRTASLNAKEKEWLEGTLHPTSSDVVTTVSTKIRVTAVDPKQFAARIDSLGAKMLQGKDEEAMPAAQQLAAYQDDRVVPFLIRAVEGKEGWLQWNAIQALGRHPTDAAVEALGHKLNLSGQDMAYGKPEDAEKVAATIREDAARALLMNPHPKAIELLASHRSDTSPTVRLTVVQAFARSKNEQTTAALREISTQDPDDTVRETAAAALK
ncbi:MAG: HEAT repeat domain-containing protein [Luteolibacter sp.]